MKRVFLLLLAIFLVNCAKIFEKTDAEKLIESNKSVADLYFQGNHKLLSLHNYLGTKNNIDLKKGIFCLLYSSVQQTEKKASFVWLNNKNEYVFTELPISQVRFQINDTIKEPYCKFKWIHNNLNTSNKESVDNILYVVLVLKDENIINESIQLELN
jgi:hypothetical protein